MVKQSSQTSDAVAPCPAASQCGACSGGIISYDEQLAAKDRCLAELFAEWVAEGTELRPIRGMDDPFHYRNKVTTPFAPGKRGPNGGREILYGMYAPGSHRIISKDACLIENEAAQEVIRSIPPLMKRYRLAPYDEDRGSGFVRHAIVRVGHESGEMLLTLVTNGEAFPGSRAFCRDLLKRCPQVTTVVQNINTAATNTILGQRERRLYGPGFILDRLCGLSFRISSRSFYQVNATQTAVLYERAMALAQLSGCRRAIDAYCGTGTIGLVAAARGAGEVVGVDTVESAIRDAGENARHNGLGNARFVAADAAAFMEAEASAGQGADVVFLDPPRSGCSEPFLEALGALGPQRIVYISCNPRTQCDDLRFLARFGYRVPVVEAVDMFPHTEHIESIAVLQKAEG